MTNRKILPLLILCCSGKLNALEIAPHPDIPSLSFRVTTFATNLYFPYGLARLPDGSLLVGTSPPRTSTNGFFGSRGELLRFVDGNGDGVADGPGEALAIAPAGGTATGVRNAPGDVASEETYLPGTLIDLRVIDRLVMVVSAQFGNEQILVLRLGDPPAFALTLLGRIRIRFPWVHHQTYGLVLRAVPGRAGQYEVIFNVGALFNRQQSRVVIPTSGLVAAELQDASLYRIRFDDLGATVAVGDLRQIAAGVRNAAGMAFEPATGRLWFADNGIDPDPERGVVQSADELNVLFIGEAGGVPLDFGYPASYVDYASGALVGTSGVTPRVVFRELAGQGKSEGPAQLAWAPPLFPMGLRQGLFVGFHGDYDETGADNDENALVYANPETGELIHFVRPGQRGIGHLDGVFSDQDSLFLADLTGIGSVKTNNATGAIYQIKAIQAAIDCDPISQAGLEASLGADATLRVSWDARFGGCALESSDAIAHGSNWAIVQELSIAVGTRVEVALRATDALRFFRLRCPDCTAQGP